MAAPFQWGPPAKSAPPSFRWGGGRWKICPFLRNDPFLIQNFDPDFLIKSPFNAFLKTIFQKFQKKSKVAPSAKKNVFSGVPRPKSRIMGAASQGWGAAGRRPHQPPPPPPPHACGGGAESLGCICSIPSIILIASFDSPFWATHYVL